MKPNSSATAGLRSLVGLVLTIIVALNLPLTGLAQGTGSAAPAAVAPVYGRVVATNAISLPETGWGVVIGRAGGNNLGRLANGDFVTAGGNGVSFFTPSGTYAKNLALGAGWSIITGPFVSDDGQWATAVVKDTASPTNRRNMAVAWQTTAPDDETGKIPVFAVL